MLPTVGQVLGMEAVRRGEVSVSAAEAVAGLAAEEQAVVVAEGAAAIRTRAKEVHEARRPRPWLRPPRVEYPGCSFP